MFVLALFLCWQCLLFCVLRLVFPRRLIVLVFELKIFYSLFFCLTLNKPYVGCGTQNSVVWRVFIVFKGY